MRRHFAVLGLLIAIAATGRALAQPDVTWWDRAVAGDAGYYWIKSDLPLDELRDLARHLNLLYDEFDRRLGSLPRRNPEQLNVLIFQSRDDYLYTLADRYGVNALGTGGMFFVRGGESALAFWTADLPKRRVLHVAQHEAFHQFAYSRFGANLPIWVNEGLAEFFGEAVGVGRSFVLGQSSARVIDIVRLAVTAEKHIPFRRMLTMTPEEWSESVRAGRGQLQYHQAWSMVQFLIYGHGGRYTAAFEAYLRLLADGVESEQAFIRAFGTADIEAFEARWKEWAAQAKPGAFITALERTEFLAEGLLELSRRGRRVETMDDVRQALREIGFTHVVSRHDYTVTFDAEDDDIFTIPKDDLARQQPVFAFQPPRRATTRRERIQDEERPMPPGVTTEHLRPHRIAIRWHRDRRTNTLRYEMHVQ